MTADIQHLLQSGIESLGIKLQAVAAVVPPTDEGDLIYLTRLADAWSYFFSTTLVFLQAVFLPATAPPIMSSMDVSSSMSSSAAPISTTTTSLGPNATAQHPLASHSQYPLAKGLIGLSVLHGIPLPEPRPLHELRVSLDIRSTALVKFKDCLLWPIRLRLQELCSSEKKIEFANGGSGGGARDTFGRISHMLSILASVTENDFEREFLVSCLTSFCHVNGSL